MWRPGFEYEAAVPARISGVHRAMCIYSFVYRGTKAVPGLVLGLDASGCCEGLAFRVAPELWPETVAYLYRREMLNNVYIPVTRPVMLADGEYRAARALVFIANRRHEQYAGTLPLHIQAAIVRRAHGTAGANAGYVANTVAHLHALGIHDRRMERLMRLTGRRVSGLTAS
jgi:cation transport protein ChaC